MSIEWALRNLTIHFICHGPEPTVAYTAGMWAVNLPELVISGLNPPQAIITLNTVADHFKEHGSFEPGHIDRDLFTGPSMFVAVPDKAIIMNMQRALELLGLDGDLPEIPALQMIWPDRRGLFPGEPGFSKEFEGRQKILA